MLSTRLEETFSPSVPVAMGSKQACMGVTCLPAKTSSKQPLDNRDSIDTLSPYDLLRVQHSEAPESQKGMRLCSKYPILSDTHQVAIHAKQGVRSRFSGVQTCNRWFCPCCSSKRTAEHEERVRGLFRASKDLGYTNLFLTLTIPRSNDIEESLSVLQKGWHGLINSLRMMIRRRKGSDYDGSEVWFTKGLDVTFRKSPHIGIFHPHYHIILGIKQSLVGSIGKAEIVRKLLSFWRKSTIKQGVSVSDEAQKIVDADSGPGLSSYITKVCKEQTISWEITSKRKLGRAKETFGFFELMKMIKENPTDSLKWVYKSFLKAVKGSRMVDYSRNTGSWEITGEEEPSSIEDKGESRVFTLSTALFKMISAYNLNSEALKATELWSMGRAHHLSFVNFELLLKEAERIQSQGSTISQMKNLSAGFVLWVGSLQLDGILERERAENILNKLKGDRP